MNCNKDFDRNFLVENLNGSFVNKTLKNHRANVLLDREKARLPETMPIVERRIKAQDLRKTNNELTEEIYKLQNKARELQRQRATNAAKINNILYGGGGEEKKQHFHRACPADGCKGFLSTAWKCGLCKIWACPKCFEVVGYNKTDEHTCSEENLKTAEMLRKETKNCPGCAATIYKISGCDQMFCTQCKIAFSWKTGEIEKGVIHNPHFYQYQREAGQNIRNPQEVPCGGIPEYYTFRARVRNAFHNHSINTEQREWIMNFHRQANHWQHWEIRTLRQKCRELENNMEERIDYLMNVMGEEELKSKLVSKEKSRNKKLSILHVYELMNTVFTESAIDIYNNCIGDNVIKNINRIYKLLNYSNRELARISYIFSQTVKLFTTDFSLNSRKFNKTSYNEYLAQTSHEIN
tara:strand:+ start:2577 stop:3800 length:1224 start_codon:yes stop_codon:yes gene_type:complete